VLIVNSRSIQVLWPLPHQALKGSEFNLRCCLKFTKIYTANVVSVTVETPPACAGLKVKLSPRPCRPGTREICQ
jgi:hypothetical protein